MWTLIYSTNLYIDLLNKLCQESVPGLQRWTVHSPALREPEPWTHTGISWELWKWLMPRHSLMPRGGDSCMNQGWDSWLQPETQGRKGSVPKKRKRRGLRELGAKVWWDLHMNEWPPASPQLLGCSQVRILPSRTWEPCEESGLNAEPETGKHIHALHSLSYNFLLR